MIDRFHKEGSGLLDAALMHRSRHMAEDELQPPEKECPICLKSGTRGSVLTLQQNPRVQLLACDCGCMFASRMPLPSVVRDYYSRYYEGTHETATFDGSERFARHLFRVLRVPASGRVRIMDFGGGIDATVSRCLAAEFVSGGARNVEIALVDFNASCQHDWGAITVDCFSTIEEAGQGFDAVLASAIIEHIPHPREVLLSLFHALKPGGGSVYFRTPAVATIIRAASRLGVRIDFTYPGHVYDLGQAFWERLLASLGVQAEFELVHSRPSIVETEFSIRPSRTVLAHLMKLPWLLFGRSYTMVGGWEAVFRRSRASTV